MTSVKCCSVSNKQTKYLSIKIHTGGLLIRLAVTHPTMTQGRRELTGISVGLAEQSCAGVKVSERSDAQAVGGMELRLQEVTANLPNIHQLQQAGSWE